MLFYLWMYRHTVVYPCDGLLLRNKENDQLIQTMILMSIKFITVRERNHIRKDHVSHLWHITSFIQYTRKDKTIGTENRSMDTGDKEWRRDKLDSDMREL